MTSLSSRFSLLLSGDCFEGCKHFPTSLLPAMARTRPRTRPDWSTLLEHPLALIAERLPTRVDTLRFRAVCNSFRTAALPPPKSLSPYSDFKCYYKKGDSLIDVVVSETIVYGIEPRMSEISNIHPSRRTWLVKVEESRPGKAEVKIPYTLVSSRFCFRSDMLPRSFNLLDYWVKEVAKEYKFRFVDDEPRNMLVPIEKIVVSTDQFALMALTDTNPQKLIVWRNRDKEGSNVDIGDGLIEDIIYHNKKFYVLISSSRAMTVDPESLKVTQAVTVALSSPVEYLCMVKSGEDLFLASYDTNFKTRYFVNIYKLDEEKGEWIDVKNEWKERALFLICGCNFVVSAKELSGCKWNRVYIGFGGKSVFYNLEDDTFTAYNDYFGIFWPPPTWVLRES